jgi:hypothetical protein
MTGLDGVTERPFASRLQDRFYGLEYLRLVFEWYAVVDGFTQGTGFL